MTLRARHARVCERGPSPLVAFPAASLAQSTRLFPALDVERKRPPGSSSDGRSHPVKRGPVILKFAAVLLQIRATEQVHEVEISNRIRRGAKLIEPGLPWTYNTSVRARRLVAALLAVLMLSLSTWASGGTMPCAPARRCPCCKTNSITPLKSPRIGASTQCYSSCGCALQQRDQKSGGIFAIRAINEARSTDRLPIAVGIPATSKPSSHTVRIAKGAPPPRIIAVDPLLQSLRI